MLAAYANVVLSGHPNLILGGVFELWPGGEGLTVGEASGARRTYTTTSSYALANG